MNGRKAPKGEIRFCAVWREPPDETLLIEAGVRTLVDHLAPIARSEPMQTKRGDNPVHNAGSPTPRHRLS